jgi:DNA-binding MarR family transcriptional regulator
MKMQEKDNYTRVPFRLFDQLVEKEMDVKDVLVYFAITRNRDGFQLSLRRLNRITGIPRPTIQKCIDRLITNRYISKKTRLLTDTITISREPTEIMNQYVFFTNKVDFDVDKFRTYPNFWLHLPTDRRLFIQMYPGTKGWLLSPVDVVVLMYIKRKKFESDKQRLQDPYRVNFTEDAATLGLTRGTFSKSFKRLSNLRFISYSQATKHVGIRHSAIRDFVKLKKTYALAKVAREEIVMKEFSVIDRVNLEVKIREAGNVVSVQIIKEYVLELFGTEIITEAQMVELIGMANDRDSYLRAHYEEALTGETLTKEDFYPIKTRAEVSFERAQGHYS